MLTIKRFCIKVVDIEQNILELFEHVAGVRFLETVYLHECALVIAIPERKGLRS